MMVCRGRPRQLTLRVLQPDQVSGVVFSKEQRDKIRCALKGAFTARAKANIKRRIEDAEPTQD